MRHGLKQLDEKIRTPRPVDELVRVSLSKLDLSGGVNFATMIEAACWNNTEIGGDVCSVNPERLRLYNPEPSEFYQR